MKQLTTMISLLLLVALISCTKENSSSDPSDPSNPGKPAGKAYTISGSVKDVSGNPVKSARIRVENPNGNNIHYTTTSDEAGKYSITVSAIGGYKIYAWKETEAEGQVYQVRLGMEKETDYDAFNVPASGTTKNFVWKLNGRIPDRVASKENGTGYFGGTVKFINYNSITDQLPAGTEVSISFTPVAKAKYLDGTSAVDNIVEKKFTIANGVGQAYYINDIPATKYKITASCIINGVYKDVYIGNGNPDVFLPRVDYYFKSEGGSGSYESGLGSPNEYAFYIMAR